MILVKVWKALLGYVRHCYGMSGYVRHWKVCKALWSVSQLAGNSLFTRLWQEALV